MTKIPDTSNGYEIGKRYRVPCVQAGREVRPYWAFPGEWIPVLLPKHSDKEIINFPYPHWHIDYRFLNERTHQRMWENEVYGIRPFDERRVLVHFRAAIVVCEYETTSGLRMVTAEPVLRIKTCLPPPLKVFPTVRWHAPLEEAMQGRKIENNRCPHRGVDVTDCHVLNGKRMCPAHGLVFNLAGEIVTGKEAAAFRLELRESISEGFSKEE